MKRRFPIYALLSTLSFGCCAGSNAFPRVPTFVTLPQEAATPDLISEGKGFLQRGRRLERGIALFQEAVKRKPGSAEYQTYLGMAYAARAFVLARYIRQRAEVGDRQIWHDDFVREWQRIQKTEGHPLAFLPPPVAPLSLSSPEPKDESQSDAELREEIARLADLTRDHLKEGSRLLKQDSDLSDETRVELLNLQGWAAVLLLTECYRGSTPPKKITETRKLMEEALDDATTRSRDDAQRLSTGDAYVLSVAYRHVWDALSEDDSALLKRGLTLLEEAALRARNRGALWYWIGLQRMRLDEAAVVDALAKAARYDKTNAIYQYTYAVALIKKRWPQDGKFKEQDSNEILAAMRSGNAAPNVRFVAYTINTPKLLRWTFADYAPDPIEITGRLGAFAELEFRRALEQPESVWTPKMTIELAKAGILFYKSYANGSLADTERQRLARTGRLMLALSGTLTAAYRVRTRNRQAIPELGFTVPFTTPSLQKMVEEL